MTQQETLLAPWSLEFQSLEFRDRGPNQTVASTSARKPSSSSGKDTSSHAAPGFTPDVQR